MRFAAFLRLANVVADARAAVESGAEHPLAGSARGRIGEFALLPTYVAAIGRTGSNPQATGIPRRYGRALVSLIT